MTYYINAGSVYAISIMFPILCTLSTWMRFKSRFVANLSIGADDWFALIGLVFTIGCGVILIIGAATHTIGYHSPALSAAESLEADNGLVLISKLQYAFYPLSVIGIAAIRFTFLFLYRRIFRFTTFNALICVVIVIVALWTVLFFFANIFQCGVHFWAVWSTEEATIEYCPLATPLQIGMMISDAIIDIIILAMPIVPVVQLKMSPRRRLLILLLFSLGILSVAASFTRMVFGIEMASFQLGSNQKIFGLNGTSDALGVLSTFFWWTYLEMGVGCLASNLPPTIGLVRTRGFHYVESLFARVSLHSLSKVVTGSVRNNSKGSKDEESQVTETGDDVTQHSRRDSQ